MEAYVFRNCVLISALALSTAAPSLAFAQTQSQPAAEFYNPCESEAFAEWDFWIGDWVAFDYDTGVVQGIDRIEKINNGCVIVQDWSQMTDRYRSPGSPDRYAGISYNTLVPGADGPVWEQTWISQYGGVVRLRGGLDADGRIVISTPEFPTQSGQIAMRTWYWAPLDGGRIHSWGEVRVRDEGGAFAEPTIPWNLIYVSRHDIPNLIAVTED